MGWQGRHPKLRPGHDPEQHRRRQHRSDVPRPRGRSLLPPSIPDVQGTFNSLGGNLIGDDTGSTGWVSSDQVGTFESPIDPMLGALALNAPGLSRKPTPCWQAARRSTRCLPGRCHD